MNKRQKSSEMIAGCLDGQQLKYGYENRRTLNPETVEEEPTNKSSDEMYSNTRNKYNNPQLLSKGKAVFQVYKHNTEESLIAKWLDEMADEPAKHVQELYNGFVKSKRKQFLRRFRRLNEKIAVYNPKEHQNSIDDI